MQNEFLYPSRSSRIYYIRTQLRNAIDEFAHKYCQDAKLIDYGCGDKPYLPLLNAYVASYVGADLQDNPQADVIIDTSGTVDLPDASADVVLSTQVLEHVSSPDLYLRECYRLLSAEGLLIISTHGHWPYHPHPTDYWRWTNEGLKKIIAENGFEVIQFRGLLCLGATGLQIFQDHASSWVTKLIGSNRLGYKLQSVFTWIMQWVIQFIDKRVNQESKSRDAAVFIVVCRKSHL